MRLLICAMLALLASGCAYYSTPVVESGITRGEFEASKARSECRLMARNLLQIARCDGR